jgi:hypothetical protein
MSAASVTPAATPSEPSNLTMPTRQISLDQWYHVPFGMTDKEMHSIMANEHFVTLQMQEAFRALANQINTNVFSNYYMVYGMVGTPGTTPFGTGREIADATEARSTLNNQLAPKTDRWGILDSAAETAALNLGQFSDADKRGNATTKTEGELGKVVGINWNGDDYVPTHTAGTVPATGDLTVNGAHATTGVKTLSLASSGASGTFLQGDVFTIAGHNQTYTLTATATVASTFNVTIEPGLQVALSGSEAVTRKETHVVNLAAQRECFGLAMRAPDAGLKELISGYGGTQSSVSMQDPVTGLVMRLELIRMYKEVMWDLDAMWGSGCIRPECGVRIAG